MSSYSGRNGVNVSQYLANLNTIPSPQDTATPADPPSREEDFSLFMNTDFFDQFNDAGAGNVDLSAQLPDFDLDANSQAGPADRVNSGANAANEPKMDFNLNGKWSSMPCIHLKWPCRWFCRSSLAAHCSDVVHVRCISPNRPPTRVSANPAKRVASYSLPHAPSTTQAQAPYSRAA